MARLSSAALIGIAAALATGAALGQRHADSAPGWAGVYSAHFDGDTRGEVTVVRQRNTRAPYRLSMNMGSSMARRDWCTGELEGSGAPAGPRRLIFTIPNIGREGVCRVTLTRGRNGLRVQEDDCLDFHGVSCAFDGTAHKRR